MSKNIAFNSNSSTSLCPSVSETLYLSSKDKVAGTYNSGTINLPHPVTGCKKLILRFASIPNTVYSINATFTYNEGGVDIAFPLVGFFTIATIRPYIEAQMTALTGVANVYTITFDANTGLMTYTAANPFSIIASAATFPNYKLGFLGADVASVPVALVETLITPAIINLYPPKVALLYLGATLTANQVFKSSTSSSGHFAIPLSCNNYEIESYYQNQVYDQYVKLIKGQTLSSIPYRLYDASTGELLELNSDWEMIFTLIN